MTSSQRITLMSDWYPAACAAQGWDPSDRAFRIRVLSVAVSLYSDRDDLAGLADILDACESDSPLTREITSASDLDTTRDIDAVKSMLQLLTDDIDAALEVGDPTLGRARRLRAKIGWQLNCLNPYLAADPSSDPKSSPAQRYLAAILADKFRPRSGLPSVPLSLGDLTADPIPVRRPPNYVLSHMPSQLDQVVITLGRVLRSKRRAAGHTIHDMLVQASLPCRCSRCRHSGIPEALEPSAEAEAEALAEASRETAPF